MIRIVRAGALEPVPDGTRYAALDLPEPLAGGVVAIPAGARTWRHDHDEVEVFAALSDLRVVLDETAYELTAGDVIVVPPFTRHTFEATRDAALLSLYTRAPSPAPAPARAPVLVADHASANGAIHRRLLSSDDTVISVEPLPFASLDLELTRAFLPRLIDDTLMPDAWMSELARSTATRLPEIAIDATLTEAVAWHRAAFERDRRLVVCFPAHTFASYGLVAPLIAYHLGLRGDRMLELRPDEPFTLTTTTGEAGAWARVLGSRVRERGRVSAGMWSGRHLAIKRALDALTTDDLGLRAQAVDRVMPLARGLSDGPWLAHSETWESRCRTALALEIEACELLAALAAPIDPDIARAVARGLAGEDA